MHRRIHSLTVTSQSQARGSTPQQFFIGWVTQMSDKIIFEGSGIELETPPEPAEPVKLADLVVDLRHAGALSVSSHLSDEAIRSLVVLAFYLSIREDEGRFPRLRLISGTMEDARLSAKFSSPAKFEDVHELRRLAPAAGTPDFALLVAESDDGTLCCPGLANIGHLGLNSIPGRPEMLSVGGTPSFRIWIEGPGHLFVQEGSTTFEFRAGRVRLVLPALYTIPGLQALTSRVGEALHRKAMGFIEGVDDAEKYFGGRSGVSGVTSTILMRLLDSCLELRHGGAFVIIPGEVTKPESYGITCKFPLQSPDLGDNIAHYWAAHVQASFIKKEGVEQYDRQLVKCNQSKARLLTNVQAVSSMSAADGCVVMNEQLRILGFGGNIVVSEAECKRAKTKTRLSRDKRCNVSEFLKSVGGQRHQSAARLVIKYTEAIVFVVSQDGELSVFASDADGYVRAYRPVDASFTPDKN